ncbi:rod shape-determining protein RodA [Candidatus Beckwithbacteria bacterium CG10_big_fil_rev_8_21_14_0_10_34_10]|uniref:Probable peptidoglycan glycosyltransferase FtsW n=1 Tax=Candidatus Beckwithbacteria bacterium CG10_big_fil_rev_8_21_14_0_10_34_10 TaxID=1974495 RepID=A0A2H0WA80_9BACT|nr:MAG: rod shape-determining protein RodA [Candidatus Beckwithbacteria bacterium CG10_big_fil_rev_8_21_14_0_10_34_10]
MIDLLTKESFGQRFFKKIDLGLIFLCILLTSFSLLILYSLEISLFKSQLQYFLFGFLIFFIVSRIDYQVLKGFYLPIYVVSILLLLLNPIFGQVTRETTRWIRIGSLNFQSSEFVKPLLLLFFAAIVEKLDFNKFKSILIFIFCLFVPVFLVFKQPDLGSALVILISSFSILFYKGLPKKYFFIGFLTFIIVTPLSWGLLKPYQRERVTSFVNPSYDPLGTGYNLIQSRIALGSGQFLGQGLGQGSQSQLRFLPERHSDFIFASLGEELGFLGTGIVILVFFFLILRIVSYLSLNMDLFSSSICFGTAVILGFQIVVNLGMNLGLLPITGLTLPLLSYGGSSLVSTFILLGLVQSGVRQSQGKKAIEIK